MTTRIGVVARREHCLPTSPARCNTSAPLPSGPVWLHEIKHDGFRIVAQKEGDQVRLITRNGHDFTDRYTLMSTPSKGCP